RLQGHQEGVGFRVEVRVEVRFEVRIEDREHGLEAQGKEDRVQVGLSLPEAEIGVFGGSGFYQFLDDVEEVAVQTPFGSPSARVRVGDIGGRRVAVGEGVWGEGALRPARGAGPAAASRWPGGTIARGTPGGGG